MPVKAIPEGYHSATPYLIVPGVDRVIEFLEKVFDAKESERMARPDGSVMHAEVRIGDSLLMLGEPMGQFGPMPASLYMFVPDVDAVYQRALKAGGTSVMEPADQFYGDRNAGVKDSAGNIWWMATRKENVAPDEIRKRFEARSQQAHG
jgi:PhnB protein